MNHHMNHTADELRDLPTLATGQADDLKIEEDGVRVWLSRCGVADGLPTENTIFIEKLDPETGQWADVAEYEG